MTVISGVRYTVAKTFGIVAKIFDNAAAVTEVLLNPAQAQEFREIKDLFF